MHSINHYELTPMHEEFHAELIRRFFNALDLDYREALGNAKILVSFASGNEKTVELAETYGLIISPAIPILHIQCESWGHLRCLTLLEAAYLKAASRAGFKLLSMCETEIIGVAVSCKEEESE